MIQIHYDERFIQLKLNESLLTQITFSNKSPIRTRIISANEENQLKEMNFEQLRMLFHLVKDIDGMAMTTAGKEKEENKYLLSRCQGIAKGYISQV